MVRVEFEFEDLNEAINRLAADKIRAAELMTEIQGLRSQLFDKDSEIARLNSLGSPIVGPKDNQRLSELLVSCANRNKIGAIKMIRSMLGLGLREAKDFYESYYESISTINRVP